MTRGQELARDVVDAAARTLALEALAVRICSFFESLGIDALLLKGAVSNRLLYGDPLARPYRDVDILVSPQSQAAAETALSELGFRNHDDDVLAIYRTDYEAAWVSDAGCIDLHTRLAGIPASSASMAWDRLWQTSEEFSIHRRRLRCCGLAGRALLLGLHAARSQSDAKSLADLELGLRRIPERIWRHAADMATELDSAACFSLGLRRSKPGAAMLDRWGFKPPPSIEAQLLAFRRPQQALVIARTFGSGGESWAGAARWFTTNGPGRPSARTVIAVLAQMPRSLVLVLIASIRLLAGRRKLQARLFRR